MNSLTVVILTYNESLHISRCIQSVSSIANRVIVIDSNSSDETCSISKKEGADVYSNPWVNHATQFNWGLDNCDVDTQWVMRMDADEYITSALASEITQKLPLVDENINGLLVKRRVYFMTRWIKHGDYYPIWLLRIFRTGKGRSESKWMDEHIKVDGNKIVKLDHDIVDENQNTISWWTEKHNNYATLEAFEIINNIYNIYDSNNVSPELFGSQIQRKRWLKVRYAKMPLFLRPFLYYFYRYILRLGFLDGKEGLIWHFLQGFWYRFLVDVKIFELYSRAGKDRRDVLEYIKTQWKIDLEKKESSIEAIL